MKACLLYAVLIFLLNSARAQEQPQAFGKLSVKDFETSNEFGSTANAIKLIDQGKLFYMPFPDEKLPYRAMFERRVRIQVRNEAGRTYGELKIPLYTGLNNERMLNISAYTYNLSAGKIKRTAIQKKSIYTSRINSRWSQVSLVFPEVQVGTIIEYKYLVQSKSIAQVKDWIFQGEIPTRYSEYQVRIPSNFHFTIHPLVSGPVEITETSFTEPFNRKGTTTSATGMQKNFIMRQLPAVTDEPQMGSRKDYLQRISCLLSDVELATGSMIAATSSWEEIITDLQAEPGYGGEDPKLLKEASTLLKQARDIVGKINRMIFIYSFLKKSFKWNGETSLYASRDLANIFTLRTGNSADLNLLLGTLLQASGVDAKAVLASSRANGMVNKTLPSINQFNKVVTLAEADNKTFLLDATDAYGDHRLKPLDLLHTTGFIVEGSEGRWLEINDTAHRFSVSTALRAEIDTAELFRAEAFITAADYARSTNYSKWTSTDPALFPGMKSVSSPNLKLITSQVSNQQADSLPLEMKLNFEMQTATSGDFIYFALNFLPGFANNEFTAAQRSSDIDFGYLQNHRFFGSVVIPPNYTFEEVPATFSLMMPDSSISFRRFTNTESNVLNINLTVTFKRSYFTASEYPEFSNFYKILFAKLNEPVILKRLTR
ncbi:MAG: DUF3857 domain-containing protein [Bacteroidota bacterium]